MLPANKLIYLTNLVAEIGVSLEGARHCHRVFMSGMIDWRTKTKDREWYRETRNIHLASARAKYNKLKQEVAQYAKN